MQQDAKSRPIRKSPRPTPIAHYIKQVISKTGCSRRQRDDTALADLWQMEDDERTNDPVLAELPTKN